MRGAHLGLMGMGISKAADSRWGVRASKLPQILQGKVAGPLPPARSDCRDLTRSPTPKGWPKVVRAGDRDEPSTIHNDWREGHRADHEAHVDFRTDARDKFDLISIQPEAEHVAILGQRYLKRNVHFWRQSTE